MTKDFYGSFKLLDGHEFEYINGGIFTFCMVADLCHVVLSCFRGEKAKRRHTKTRRMVTFSCFHMATFRSARQRYDKQGRKRERSPRENPPNGDFFVFSHGDLSPPHTKVRDISRVAFSATVCRIFACRGERSPCENPTKSPFGETRLNHTFACHVCINVKLKVT